MQKVWLLQCCLWTKHDAHRASPTRQDTKYFQRWLVCVPLGTPDAAWGAGL